MKRVSRQVLFAIALLAVFMLVWPKVNIWVRIDVSLWQALFLFAVVVIGIFLVLDHLINRSR